MREQRFFTKRSKRHDVLHSARALRRISPRTIVLGVMAMLCFLAWNGSAVANSWIVENGQPRAEIVIAEKPLRTVRLAAAELQDYLEKISGARLPIVTAPSGTAVKLFVGRTRYTDQLRITAEGLHHGAYRLVSGDDWMVFLGEDTEFVPREPWPRSNATIASGELQKAWEAIAGGPWRVPNATMWKDRHKIPATVGLPDAAPRPGKNEYFEIWAYDERGSYNAVCGFLRKLGVRWLFPGELGEIVPHMDSIPLPKIDETVRPDFEIRQFSFHGPWEWAQWGMRLGVRYPYGMQTAHGMSGLARPEIFAAHPDWFAMYGGQRRFDPNADNNHFCYSNEELFRETVRYVRAQFDVYDFPGVSVMPPDAYLSICQCPLCAGKADPERGPRGVLSNHVWDFVNRVAKEVAKTHPQKLIYCCAYGTYSLPPANITKLEPNVQVAIVGGRRPKSGVAKQAEVRAFRESWLPKTDRPILIFENYPLTSRGWYLPCFMARTIGQSINETKGISCGEEIWISPHQKFDGAAMFDAFQVYFTATMYWGGKEQDVEALLDEYCRLLYGPAGDTMKSFFDYCELYWQDMETDKVKADTALRLFDEAKAKLDPTSIEARRLALLDQFLDSLRKKSALLGQKRGVVPKLRLVGEAKDLVIDGRLDEPFWKTINPGSVGRLRELQTGRPPALGTTAMVGWYGDSLYFGIRCDEVPGEKPNVATTKHDDPAIWYGDVVEILLDTNMHSYYQIAINPAGAVADLDRGMDRDSALSWNSLAKVAVSIDEDHWTVEVRIPVTDDQNDPLHQVVGRKPTQSLPWHVNICRQRLRSNGVEHSAFSPTGTTSFHHLLSFGHLYAGLSHTFEADPTVTNYPTAFRAATNLPKEEALTALVALAEGSHGKLTELQQSHALKQAAAIARSLKDYGRAEELTARIPVEAERKNSEMLNLLARRQEQQLIDRFGHEDFAKWPFWAAGEAYFSRGRAYAALGERAKAESDFKAALPLIGDSRTRQQLLKALQKITPER
ncbi:MAG: DUF4838 domain-containing protein [Thermogutta sp.]